MDGITSVPVYTGLCICVNRRTQCSQSKVPRNTACTRIKLCNFSGTISFRVIDRYRRTCSLCRPNVALNMEISLAYSEGVPCYFITAIREIGSSPACLLRKALRVLFTFAPRAPLFLSLLLHQRNANYCQSRIASTRVRAK